MTRSDDRRPADAPTPARPIVQKSTTQLAEGIVGIGPETPEGYLDFLEEVRGRISEARLRAALSVNAELVRLYWQIGSMILERERRDGWGAKVVDRLSVDLRALMPGTNGFSRRNLHYMRAIAAAYPTDQFVQQPVAQIPWGHITVLLDAVSDPELRLWYAQQTIEHGWTRAALVNQIKSALHERQGRSLNNFQRALPAPDSELVRDLLKDPYNLEFVELAPGFKERELEDALLNALVRFMLELGRGFAFVGRQYRLVAGTKEYFIDLLFYNYRLNRFFVIDLKIDEFEPEYAGKMNFYLNLVDDQVRGEGDGDSIGIILCARRDETIVEYALRDLVNPIAVSEYSLARSLPDQPAASALPTVEELQTVVETTRHEVLLSESG